VKNRYCSFEALPEQMKLNLFHTINDFVEKSGGDGGATIFCQVYDYKEVANCFENWLNKTYPNHHLITEKYDLHILFTDRNNENISFRQIKLGQAIEDSFDDLTIRI